MPIAKILKELREARSAATGAPPPGAIDCFERLAGIYLSADAAVRANIRTLVGDAALDDWAESYALHAAEKTTVSPHPVAASRPRRHVDREQSGRL